MDLKRHLLKTGRKIALSVLSKNEFRAFFFYGMIPSETAIGYITMDILPFWPHVLSSLIYYSRRTRQYVFGAFGPSAHFESAPFFRLFTWSLDPTPIRSKDYTSADQQKIILRFKGLLEGGLLTLPDKNAWKHFALEQQSLEPQSL